MKAELTLSSAVLPLGWHGQLLSQLWICGLWAVLYCHCNTLHRAETWFSTVTGDLESLSSCWIAWHVQALEGGCLGAFF